MGKKATKIILFGLGLAALGAVLTFNAQHTQPALGDSEFQIKKVIDGDTFQIDRYGKEESVRLIGIDTPEVVDPRKPVQCFGREASEHAHQILDGRRIRLEFDPLVGERDKYGRLLAYGWTSDGQLYNEVMIAGGYAHEYTYQRQAYKYQARLKSAEAAAQANLAGFWAPETCNGKTK